MTIEEEVFKKTKMDFAKLSKYGFKKEKDLYKYSKNIMNNTFRIDIEVNKDGLVKGKIFDLSICEEYTNFRVEENTGSFVSKLKSEFKNLLEDIKNNCFIKKDFIYEQANRIAKSIKEKYGDDPEFEWEKYPGYGVFKNKDSHKWYGIIMNVDKNKLDKESHGEVEIIDIKLNQNEIKDLLKQDGFYPAYHMNKNNWISIILNNTVRDEDIMNLIAKSDAYTISNKNSASEWIIPANPKYFDIENALKENKTIIWKQNADIKINDIVYIYVGSPYSSIMYKFKVKEINIPYEYQDKNLKMKKAMKIDLVTRYEKGKLSFAKLKEFGVNAIRSQRYMPLVLSEYINKF